MLEQIINDLERKVAKKNGKPLPKKLHKKDKFSVPIPSLTTVLWTLNLSLFTIDLITRWFTEDPILHGIFCSKKKENNE